MNALFSEHWTTMATAKKPVVNLEKLDYAALKQLLGDVAERVAVRRDNELKILVNAWAQKAEQSGMAVADVISEFRHYLPASRRPKTPSKLATAGAKPYRVGVTYKNPESLEAWIGGTRGRQPPWLRHIMGALISDEAKAAKYELLAVTR